MGFPTHIESWKILSTCWDIANLVSQDEERIIVCNGGSKSVEVLSSKDLKKMGGFFTGNMHPLYAHEIRAFGGFEEEKTVE